MRGKMLHADLLPRSRQDFIFNEVLQDEKINHSAAYFGM